MIREELALSGRLRVNIVDRHGRLIGQRQNNNKIVSSGRALVANLFGGNTAMDPISYFGIGTGNNSTADTDTGLQLEVPIYTSPDQRKSISVSGIIPITGTNQWKVEIHGVLTMAESNGLFIKEVGLFNFQDLGSTNPNTHMYNRVVFQEIEKTSLFELQFFWEIIF